MAQLVILHAAGQAGATSALDQRRHALKLDVNAWFTPTAEGYFSRVNRARILTDIDEAKGEHAPALEKLKKSELADRAESLVAGTGWLPAPMRIAANENVPQDQTMAVAAE